MKKIISALLVIMLVLSMIPVTAMAAETVTATLSFANKAQRTSFSSTQQVWEQNGVKLTNDKAASTNAVADYANPARFYANSKVTVEYPNMTKIEFTANSGSYATALKNSIGSTATVSGSKVTVQFSAPQNSFVIAKMTAQVRMNSLTVTAQEASDTGCAHETLVEGTDGFAATCTTPGQTNSQICADCEEVQVYPAVIPALGHTVVDGACTVCGEAMTMYDLVTDVAELTTGSQVVIVATGFGKALSVDQAGNNRPETDIVKSGTQVALNDKVQVLTVGTGTVANTYSFSTGDKGYLYAAGGDNNNYLRTKTTLDATGSFTVEITEAGVATIKAQGNVARNWLRYNDQNNIFSCYGETSTQKDIAIYKLAGTGSEPVECDHPSSTAQNNAVAPTCTGVGYTATETCDTCGAITKPAEEIPALGHDFVDYSCSVCLAIDPESPLTATRLKGELPANGDKILFYHYSSKVIMSEIFNSYGERLVGVNSVVADGALPYGASAAVLTVGITEDDEFYFVTESGKYLASAEKGNALVLADELDDLSLWTVNALEAGSFNIINNGASYDGTAYDQTLEVYNGMFTTYGLKDTTAYQIDIYLVEAAPVCEHTNTSELADGKEPTCTETGLTNTVVCADCGETITAQTEIPAYGHAWVEQEAVEATCVHAGHVAHFECCVCVVVSLDKETLLTKEAVQLPVNPDAHAWDEGVYTEPTTEADGYTTYTCGLCAAEEVEIDEGSKLPPVVVENAIIKQPESVTVDSGNDVQFKVEATGDVVSYKWEYRKVWKWFNTSMEGYNTDTLTVPANGARNGYDYRCVITFADGTELISEPAELTVNTYITDVVGPNDQVVVVGYKGQFTASAEGDGIKYAWQYSRDGGEHWYYTQMEGYTKPTVLIETTTARDGYMYRCEIKDVTGNVTVYTEPATMRVLSFKSHPVETFAATDATVQFTVTTSVDSGFTYQWQYSTDGEKWTNTTLTGYNTDTLTVQATAARNGYQYRCQLTGSKNSKIESKAAVLHVGDPVVITAQPADVTVAAGEVATFTVEATNVFAYQWQYQNATGTKWGNTGADGNQTATLNVTTKASNNGYKYRCIVYGLDGTETITEFATLTIG